MSKPIKILFIADIVGNPGFLIFEKLFPSLKKKYGADFCIANGENLTEGKGVNDKDVNKLFLLGIDIITSGNHVWDTFKSVKVLNTDKRVLRPLNYPRGNPGVGSAIIENNNGLKLGVLNLQGRTFMPPLDNPFFLAIDEIKKLKHSTPLIFVDFHAEATAEKIAMGWHLDGKVCAVIGTHTHVQTADERVLPNGTAYITDAGMTGPYDSVIGMKKEVALHRFLYSTNRKYELASENLRLCGVLITVNSESNKAESIERINLP